MGKLFANVGYQWRPTGKKFTSGKLNCGYQWRPTGKKFALGELCPLTRLPVTYSEPVPTTTVVNALIVSTNTSVSTTIAQDAPSTSPFHCHPLQVHPPVFPQCVAAGPTFEDTLITQADLHPSVNPVEGEPSSAQSTSGDVSLAEPNQVNQPPDHLRK
ncbi:hypothetical protein Tco_0251459 [Tanacetum coccineum]